MLVDKENNKVREKITEFPYKTECPIIQVPSPFKEFTTFRDLAPFISALSLVVAAANTAF